MRPVSCAAELSNWEGKQILMSILTNSLARMQVKNQAVGALMAMQTPNTHMMQMTTWERYPKGTPLVIYDSHLWAQCPRMS